MTPAIIFDLDGVIIDSGEPHQESWALLGAEVGIKVSDEDFKRTFGRRNDEIIPLLFGDRFSAEELGQRKEALYRGLIKGRVPQMPGAVDLVQSLSASGHDLAVGSSAPFENVDLVLTEMRIKEHFSAMVCGEDVTCGKPDPQVFLIAADKLGRDPSECVVVEDAPAGIAAARAAGMIAVALIGSHDASAFPDADHCIDLLEAFESLPIS